jgi:uncharacterized protein
MFFTARSARRGLAATVASVVTALAAGLLAPAGASAVPAAPAAPAADAPDSAWEPRSAEYDGVVTTTDLPIEMSDGVTLYADLTRPADAGGDPITTPLPVIVTITAYNKTVIGGGGGAVLAGADPHFLVERGYAQLTVDARGTGASEGTWKAFGARENRDAGEIVEWAHEQEWSTGEVGMTGASYMGISQLFAAGHRPDGLKAIFPQVPAADVYRDVVASGGQIDVGFIPLWMGLVTGTGLIPPTYAAGTPDAGLTWLLDRLSTATTFTLPLLLNAALGNQPAYDSAFYRERSPIEVIDEVDVPTFLIGGEFDLFQRGTPMLFERLQANGVPTRMIIGPWDHLQGSSGAEVGEAGHGSLAELQLRWFDHWIKGRDGALDEIAPLTYYEQGSGAWVEQEEWIGDDLSARSFALSGRSTLLGNAGGLTTGTPEAGRSPLVPLPVSGLCTRSANQWTAGILGTVWPDSPCLRDNALNDLTGLVFETEPVTTPVRLQGPMNARLHVSAPSGDGMLSVIVEDVAPDGTVTHLTGGWQVISQRALDEERSRYLDGELIQPHHPFTKAAKQPLRNGRVAPVDVEIFPTGAVIRPGHRLRIAVQGFDVPHLLAPVTGLVQQALPLTIHTGPETPSRLTIPVR